MALISIAGIGQSGSKAEWLTPLARKANASIGLEVMGSNPIRIKFFTQVKFSNSNRIFQNIFSVRKPAHFISYCRNPQRAKQVLRQVIILWSVSY